MNTSIQSFQFDSLSLEVFEYNNEHWFIARPLAEYLGYQNPAEAIKTNVDDEDIEKIYIPEKSNNYICINESGLYSLILRSNKIEAKKFKKWVTSEVLPSIRKTGSYHVKRETSVQPSLVELQILDFASSRLRMSDTSIIRSLSIICEEKGISPRFLPQYSDEQLTRALGDLLKEHGSHLSAKRANPLLEQLGLLEKITRRSTGGNTKQFWSITDRGLKYGKNETSPQNPRETQPRWYVAKFGELLKLLEEVDFLEVA